MVLKDREGFLPVSFFFLNSQTSWLGAGELELGWQSGFEVNPQNPQKRVWCRGMPLESLLWEGGARHIPGAF